MPSIAQWDVNDDCNLNCKHCRVSEKNKKEPALSLKQAKELLAQLYYCRVTRLNLSGGEPFLRKDFFDILEYAKRFEEFVERYKFSPPSVNRSETKVTSPKKTEKELEL